MTLRLLPLVALIAGVLVVGLGTRPPQPAGATPSYGLVEEVRYSEAGGLLVRHTILIDSAVVADPAALADAVTGVTAKPAGVTAQFALNSWRWPQSAIPVPVVYDASSATAGLPSLDPLIKSAVDQWSGITAGFSFTYAGTSRTSVGACISEDQADGVNTIAYSKGMERGVLGQTCTLSTPFGKMLEFDMQINADANWGTGNPIAANQYDLQSTILHEMGHAAGIGHPCAIGNSQACSASELDAVMYPTIRRGEMKRTLQPDDVAGLKADYPGAALTPSPSPMPSPAPGPSHERAFQVIASSLARD